MKTECPRCRSQHTVKNGHVHGKAKRQCKACGFQYSRDEPRGVPSQQKLQALMLYVHGLWMNAIAKLYAVSTPAVLRWIKKYGQQYGAKPLPEARAVVLELDEMWHFIEKKLKNSGYGKLIKETTAIFWIGNAAIVIGQH